MATDSDLTRVALLAKVPERDLAALAALGSRRRYRAGAALLEEGEPGDSLHTIISGLVRITITSAEGDEATIATLRAGDSLGELSLLDGRPRSATAIAIAETESLVVGREAFWSWLDAHPAAAAAMLETLSLRIRRTTEQVGDLTFLDLTQRLAKQLLREVAVQGIEPTPEGQRVRITQSELANAVGATREATNKHLRQFEEAGWVRLGRGAVTVQRPEALRELY